MDPKQKPYSDVKRWICIYPAYIDSRKSAILGRQIRKEKAIDTPTSQEIYDILNHAGLKCELEKNKMYTRDGLRDPNVQGRVRVQLRSDEGEPVNVDFPSKHSLLLYLAEMIPKLKSRQAGAQDQQSGSGTGTTTKQKKKK